MKPEPLNLEKIKERWIDLETTLSFVEESGFLTTLEEDSKEFKERDEIITNIRELVNEQLEDLFNEVKQRLKSACEFYLRYKDNPELLIKEQSWILELEYEGNRIDDVLDYGAGCWQAVWGEDIKKYNEWLFKLAFKDVIKNE